MHKIYFTSWLFAVLLLCPLFSCGQWLLGPVAGVQLTHTTEAQAPGGGITYQQKARMGFHAGFMGALQLNSPNFMLLTQLAYSRKGRDIQIEPNLMFNQAVFHHLDVPLLLAYRLGGGSRQAGGPRLYLMGGPDFSFWLGGRGTLSGGELATVGAQRYTLRFGAASASTVGTIYYSNANRLQLGLNAGLLLHLPLAKAHTALVMVRYYHGQTYLSNNGTVQGWLSTFSDQPSVANRFLGVSCAYLLPAAPGQRQRPRKVKGRR